MKVIVPDLVLNSIEQLKRKDVRDNALKIYSILYNIEKRKNSNGYFDVPSTYLKSINSDYSRYVKHFIKFGIIQYYSNPLNINPSSDSDIFDLKPKKYYNKTHGISMKYKFLIDIQIGTEYEVDIENPNRKRWYSITQHTLTALGYDPNIGRDSFGRRIHHKAIYTYKQDLHQKGYMVIDAKCSQPRLLYLIMKEKDIYDENYFSIFENGNDFYTYLITKLQLKTRRDAKDLFMYWVGADGYVPQTGIFQLFPNTSNFIKSLKSRSYKDATSYLQRREAKIWIDDLLENIPTSHALSIHDSLVVKVNDSDKVLKYCKEKYPELEFNIEEI